MKKLHIEAVYQILPAFPDDNKGEAGAAIIRFRLQVLHKYLYFAVRWAALYTEVLDGPVPPASTWLHDQLKELTQGHDMTFRAGRHDSFPHSLSVVSWASVQEQVGAVLGTPPVPDNVVPLRRKTLPAKTPEQPDFLCATQDYVAGHPEYDPAAGVLVLCRATDDDKTWHVVTPETMSLQETQFALTSALYSLADWERNGAYDGDPITD